MTADRAAVLEALPGWVWDAVEDQWEAGYRSLLAFHRREGHLRVPAHYWDAATRWAPGWARYTAGDCPTSAASVWSSSGWTWNALEDSWERHYAALLNFVVRGGHARVPTDHVEAGLPLAAWVIRHSQDRKAGKVPADRADRLEALPGWTWDVLAARWEEHFTALEAFAAREGHARVPTEHSEGAVRLGQCDPSVTAARDGRRRRPPRRAAPGW